MRHQSETAPRKFSAILPSLAGVVGFFVAAFAPSLTETAVANGDTRTINLYHAHTQESISATYLLNGQYDHAVLQQLNWFLRDWRRDEPINMDPRLFDVVWETYRGAGAGTEVIKVVSAYRSPETNAMLRSRSRAVAKHSQHMLGKAMDTTMPGMPMSHIREIGMRMQRGGVGYYPNAGTPFVHLDVGSVRSWPRMSYDQLVRLFPDGKTVHLPANGQPLARYEEARAEIEARGNGAYVTAPSRGPGGLFAFLFGGGGGAEEDEDAGVAAPPPSTRKQWASLAPRGSRQKVVAEVDEEGPAAVPQENPDRRGRTQDAASQEIARAEAGLPRGETVMTAAPADAFQEQKPEKAEKTSSVRAPLPPQRPASLEKPAPLDAAAPERPAAVASAEAEEPPALRTGDSADIRASLRVNTPAPPRRPVALLAQPSAKPVDTARAEPPAAGKKKTNTDNGGALAHLIEATASSARPGAAKPSTRPPVTTATRTPPPSGSQTEAHPAMAYAPGGAKSVAVASPGRGAGGVLGSSIGGLRSAARAAAEKAAH